MLNFFEYDAIIAYDAVIAQNQQNSHELLLLLTSRHHYYVYQRLQIESKNEKKDSRRRTQYRYSLSFSNILADATITTVRTAAPIHEDNKLEFEQVQFFSSGCQGDGQWIVPIILCCGNNGGLLLTIMENTSVTFQVLDSMAVSYERSQTSCGTSNLSALLEILVRETVGSDDESVEAGKEVS
ncbi:hypothetical protein L2E82_25897 [Cichorium intybus]|uniref:Uncharacterized protein n=1 Tax=Cichorium intybus TaxID=13427 RepID=A0ACB9E4A6_CICIN|nr:hypothetical protein L2E82_25897 [Cichorium intybus]